MAVTTLTSREFNQDAGRAERAASDGPVFITEGGAPAHILLSIEDCRCPAGESRNIADLLAMPGLTDAELEILPRTEVARPVDLS